MMRPLACIVRHFYQTHRRHHVRSTFIWRHAFANKKTRDSQMSTPSRIPLRSRPCTMISTRTNSNGFQVPDRHVRRNVGTFASLTIATYAHLNRYKCTRRRNVRYITERKLLSREKNSRYGLLFLGALSAFKRGKLYAIPSGRN